MSEDDDGHAVSYKVLRRGTPVRDREGTHVGTVRRVQDNAREGIFDGIVVDTDAGRRFVDAPEVARIAERWVTLTITAAEVAALPEPASAAAQRARMSTTSRRLARLQRDLRRRWEDR